MKKFLRAWVIIMVVLVATTASSIGFFFSHVSAQNNQINLGSLKVMVSSIGSTGPGFVLAKDVNSQTSQLANFSPIADLLPGQSKSVYIAIQNVGSLPFDYRANFLGSWGDPQLDAQNVFVVAGVKRFPAGDCQSDAKCSDLLNWELANPGSESTGPASDFGPQPSLTAASSTFFGHQDLVSDGINTLSPHQFAIFKADLTLKDSADNSFQGKNFTYSMNIQTKQTNAPKF